MTEDFKPWMPNNCAVLEETADGRSVGRCFFYVGDKGVCPRHGDVSKVRTRYIETGFMTGESALESERDSPGNDSN